MNFQLLSDVSLLIFVVTIVLFIFALSLCLSCWSEKEDSYSNKKKNIWDEIIRKLILHSIILSMSYGTTKNIFFYTQRVSQKILSCQKMAVRLMKKKPYFVSSGSMKDARLFCFGDEFDTKMWDDAWPCVVHVSDRMTIFFFILFCGRLQTFS